MFPTFQLHGFAEVGTSSVIFFPFLSLPTEPGWRSSWPLLRCANVTAAAPVRRSFNTCLWILKPRSWRSPRHRPQPHLLPCYPLHPPYPPVHTGPSRRGTPSPPAVFTAAVKAGFKPPRLLSGTPVKSPLSSRLPASSAPGAATATACLSSATGGAVPGVDALAASSSLSLAAAVFARAAPRARKPPTAVAPGASLSSAAARRRAWSLSRGNGVFGAWSSIGCLLFHSFMLQRPCSSTHTNTNIHAHSHAHIHNR